MSWINYIHPSIFWSADPHEGLSQLSSGSRWGTPWTDCQPIAVNYVSWLLFFFFFIFGVKRKKRNGQFFQNPYPQITTNSGMTPNNIQLAYLKCLHEIYADIYLTYFCAVQKKKKRLLWIFHASQFHLPPWEKITWSKLEWMYCTPLLCISLLCRINLSLATRYSRLHVQLGLAVGCQSGAHHGFFWKGK